jgi:general secretion pathway protein G
MSQVKHKNINRKAGAGFTIIELIVVVAIIAILAVIVFVNVNGYMAKGRDARRVADLNMIAKALEMYRADNGKYPPSSCGQDCSGYWYSNNLDGKNWSSLAAYLVPKYIGSLPVDPINNTYHPWDSKGYSYAYGNVGDGSPGYPMGYDLFAQFEVSTNRLSCQNTPWKYYWGTEPCANYNLPWYNGGGVKK